MRIRRAAFTRMDLTVVLAILAIGIGLFLLFIQKSREKAARLNCENHLKQIGMAIQSYHDAFNCLPHQTAYAVGSPFTRYSTIATILPYVESDPLYRQINFELGYMAQPDVCRTRLPWVRCPSDPKNGTRLDGGVQFSPTNYGFNFGTWLGLDQQTARGGDGAFGYNMTHGFEAITDGLSNTLGAADVKSFTPALLDGGQPAAPNTPPPATPAQVVAYGGTFDMDYGHTQWVSGRALQTGLTTTFPPNTKMPYRTGCVTFDVDWTSARIGPGNPQQTYQVVTARSYHRGGVNAMMMDGSVRFVTNTIAPATWRAMGTRASGDTVAE